jgi:hypothetical protein
MALTARRDERELPSPPGLTLAIPKYAPTLSLRDTRPDAYARLGRSI